MSIMLFPTLPVSYEYEVTMSYTRKQLMNDSGRIMHEQFLSPFGPTFQVKLKLNRQKRVELGTLLRFYYQTRGGFQRFAFFDADPNYDNFWGDLYLGRGDGTTTTFDLRGKNTLNNIVTVDGVATAGTIFHGTGENGVDQIQFASPPAYYSLIKHAEFTGTLYIPKMTFLENNLTKSGAEALLYSVGMTLQEV